MHRDASLEARSEFLTRLPLYFIRTLPDHIVKAGVRFPLPAFARDAALLPDPPCTQTLMEMKLHSSVVADTAIAFNRHILVGDCFRLLATYFDQR